MNAECMKRQRKKIRDQIVIMMVDVFNKANSIGKNFSIKNSKDPLNALEVVDDVKQNGRNTILFDVVLLPPAATPLPPNAAPSVVVATKLPGFCHYFLRNLLAKNNDNTNIYLRLLYLRDFLLFLLPVLRCFLPPFLDWRRLFLPLFLLRLRVRRPPDLLASSEFIAVNNVSTVFGDIL